MASNMKHGAAETFREIGALVLRLALGIIFIFHGGEKIGIIGEGSIAQTVENFQKGMGIPPFLTYLAILAEFGGGIGMVLGFLTRLCGLGILIVMLVAIFKVHWESGFSAQAGGYEYPFALAAVSLYFLTAGGGPVSLDNLIRRAMKKS